MPIRQPIGNKIRRAVRKATIGKTILKLRKATLEYKQAARKQRMALKVVFRIGERYKLTPKQVLDFLENKLELYKHYFSEEQMWMMYSAKAKYDTATRAMHEKQDKYLTLHQLVTGDPLKTDISLIRNLTKRKKPKQR